MHGHCILAERVLYSVHTVPEFLTKVNKLLEESRPAAAHEALREVHDRKHEQERRAHRGRGFATVHEHNL